MAEKVVYLAYARVAQGATPAQAVERQHDADLDSFLLDHVDALRGYSKGKNACPAQFVEAEGKTLFETLRTGNKKTFLDAAHKITLRLIGQMTGATREGLLVCVQVKDGATQTAAVLKLQIVTEHAASLETLDSGEQLLSAVTDVMDAPGHLQKGALVEDPRPDSEVIMGDVLSKEAQYFPRAFGISIEQRAEQAAVDTLEVIRELHGDSVEIAARHVLPTVASGTLTDVLDGIGQSVAELADPDVRQAIETRLAGQARPVRRVDTSAPLTEIISASGIKIRVPVTEKDRVDWHADTNDGGWIITVRVDEEPQRELR